MASKQQTKPQESGVRHSVNMRTLRHRAPQFSAFLDAVEGREREVSPSQRKFLDDFQRQLAEGATEEDDTS